MRRADETPEVGQLWQVYDPEGMEFFDALIVERTTRKWKALDIEHTSLIEVPSVSWFWKRIA